MNTFKYGEQDITIIDSKSESVPTEAIEVTVSKEDRSALAIAINNNIATLLVGETGTGKSSIVKYLAYKRKQSYVRMNMNGYTTPDEMVGSVGVKDGKTFWQDGIVVKAMREGSILVLDEVNGTTQDCLFILHGLLDEDRRITLPNGEVVRPHNDFRVFATCNPDYEGTKTMNKAFIDRFGIILAIDVLKPAQEASLLVKRTGITEEQAIQLVTMATMARKDYIEQKVLTFVSTRSLITIANLIQQGMKSEQAWKVTVERKSTNKDEQRALHDFYLAVMKFEDKTGDELLDQPIITTKREIDTMSRDRQQAQENAREYYEKLKSVEGDKMTLSEADTQQKIEIARLNESITLLQEMKKELTFQVEAYKRLDDIIKQVSSKASEQAGAEPQPLSE